jgi:Lsr2
MAKKVIIVDDIDGSDGDGIVTQRFSLGSDYYEIDLCPQNLLMLRAALEPFVSAGRRVRSGNRHKPEPAPHQQGHSELDIPRQQPLTAAPPEQGHSELDILRQQPLTAAPPEQGHSELDFPRQQRLAIRNWARDNGYDVGERGRFSQDVLEAYREATEEGEAALR